MDSSADDTIRRPVKVLNEAGLHARPAAILAECAKGFSAVIELVLVSVPEDLGVALGTRADAKSVMDVLFLAAPCGTVIDIEATGDDAANAVARLEELFTNEFGVVS